ncbi:MAG TPA: TIGR02611 family protein [Jatrophihabitans sp.]|uniref:TIGR02611 family protein n=1 Tax=Jatrophihabitans sp. TaxID=1932789 RepID=UPI002F239DAB
MADGPAGGTRLDDREPDRHSQPHPPRWLQPIRDRVRRVPGGATIWTLLIALIGGAIVALGLVLIPLPGPGWALVFVGVAVWATEFRWAQRLLQHGRRLLRRWTAWAKRQSLLIRMLLGLVGLLVLAGAAYLGWQTLR